MPTKVAERRVRQSQERTRVKLHERKIELEAAEKELQREREQLRRERRDTIALLHLLCERFGKSDWSDETPVHEILELHLIGPLTPALERLLELPPEQRVALSQPQAPVQPSQVPQPPSLPPPPAPRTLPPPPRLLRPTALPQIVHKLLIVPAQDRIRQGFAARCTCGWTSTILSSEPQAREIGDRHVLRMAAVAPGPRREPADPKPLYAQ